MTWTRLFGRACGVLLDAIVRWLALARINPNVLTFLGLVVNTIAAFLFGYANGDNQARMFFYAGLVIIGSGFFDLVDGRVARASNQVTRFGGFFDSVIDRYSDASQYFGLLVFYARGDRFFYVVLSAFVMISSIMVSYTRARAESLIGSCKVGFMERPERLVLIIIGALFNRMAPVLWLVAVLLFESLYKPAQQGRKVAYLTLASFLFLALVLSIALFGPSRHATTFRGEALESRSVDDAGRPGDLR